MIETIGYFAIFFASISMFPQIIQMYKTKKVDDINIYFLFLAIVGDILYYIYSILVNEQIMVISIISPSIAHLTMIYLYFLYKKPITQINKIQDISLNEIKDIPLNDIIIL